MKRRGRWVWLALALILASLAPAVRATSPPASYRGLTPAVSSEADVRNVLGKPSRRVEDEGGKFDLLYVAPSADVVEIRAKFAPDKQGVVHLQQLFVSFRMPQDTQAVRSQYGLDGAIWQSLNLFNGLPCRAEYYESVLLGLVFCHEGPDNQGKRVYTLRFLSPDAYAEVYQRGSTLTGGVILQLLQALEQRGAQFGVLPVRPASPPKWSFTPQDVIEAKLSIAWPENNAQHRPVHSLIRREGMGFIRDGQPFDPAPLAALGKSLGALVPETQLQSCDDADEDRQALEILHPAIELAIRTTNRGTIKLRSSSACALMLPWNVTNGEWLMSASREAVGHAMRDLIAPVCPYCRFKQRPLPEVSTSDSSESRFAALFNSLLEDWDWFGGQKMSEAEVNLRTEPTKRALRWMDSQRFDEALKQAVQLKQMPAHVRRLIAIELVTKSNW